MKKILVTAILLATTSFYAQDGKVGVGNTAPKATLDVTGTPATATVADGIIAPRLTGDELAAKDAVYLADQRGSYVYVTAAASPTTTKTVNVTAAGYYYFDGTVWQKVATGNDQKWVDATLTSGETGAQYTGTPAGTKVFVSNTGGVLIGKDNSVSGTSINKSGLRIDTDYVDGSTEPSNYSNLFNMKTGSTSNLESSRLSIIEDVTNTAAFTQLLGAINIARKDGSGSGSSMVGQRSRVQISASASGSVGSLISLKSENAILGSTNTSLTDNIGVWSEMNNNSASSMITNVYGLRVNGSALSTVTRGGLNRYGLHIDNVNASNVQTGGQTFSIYTNAGKVSFGDQLQLRSVPTGTAVSGLGVDANGNVVSTATATAAKWADGTLNGVDGIYASDALANSNQVFVGNNGSMSAGGTATYPSSLTYKYNFTADNDFTNGLNFRLFTADATNQNRTGANLSSELLTGSTTNVLKSTANEVAVAGSATANNIFVGDNNVIIRPDFTGTINTVVGSRALLNYRNGSAGVITNSIGFSVSGEGLEDANRPGTNRIGLNIANVVPSSQQAGATAYSIYTNAGKVSFGDDVEQRGTGAFKVAAGTDTERPATPEFGMVRYNTTLGRGEMYVNDANGDGILGDAGWRVF